MAIRLRLYHANLQANCLEPFLVYSWPFLLDSMLV